MIVGIRDGLVWSGGNPLDALDADRIAEANGFVHAENLVRAHDKKTLHLSRRQRIMLTDEDWMPIGRYSAGRGDQRRIKDVPAEYLLKCIWDEFLHKEEFSQQKSKFAALREYIWENFKALEQDADDYIATHKPEPNKPR